MNTASIEVDAEFLSIKTLFIFLFLSGVFLILAAIAAGIGGPGVVVVTGLGIDSVSYMTVETNHEQTGPTSYCRRKTDYTVFRE